jgi:hypothetical protein
MNSDIGQLPCPASCLVLHELEVRQDGAEWIVGRRATRHFVALPEVGARAVKEFSRGRSVAEVGRLIEEQVGERFDVLQFAADLVELGFVAELDGRTVPETDPLPATFPWLRPGHLRPVLSPVVPVLIGILVIAASVATVRRPDLLPGYRDLLWSRHGSLVVALGLVGGWTLVFLHELAHLVTARAAGVPARIGLGTRLYFLVAETDISGIELAPRRHRLTAYLAGIAVNISVSALAVLLATTVPPATTAGRLLAAVALVSLLQLPFQLMVFMRTDVYFVLQDLARCRDLFGDGRAYGRYAALRAAWRVRHMRESNAPAPLDPSADLPEHERRAVRLYSFVLVVGTAVTLGALAAFTLPAELTLVSRAMAHLGSGESLPARLDGVLVILAIVGVHAVWATTLIRRRL